MNLLDIILLAIALAMDCFAVSIVSGVLTRKQWLPRMAFLFGFFQALMPLIGWIGISFFRSDIEAFDHWIAFALLLLIGGNMIRESFSPEEEHFFNPLRLRTQLLLAVATSIDAMAIGISFACTGFNEISQLLHNRCSILSLQYHWYTPWCPIRTSYSSSSETRTFWWSDSHCYRSQNTDHTLD